MEGGEIKLKNISFMTDDLDDVVIPSVENTGNNSMNMIQYWQPSRGGQ